jgi:hypothetical protein
MMGDVRRIGAFFNCVDWVPSRGAVGGLCSRSSCDQSCNMLLRTETHNEQIVSLLIRSRFAS